MKKVFILILLLTSCKQVANISGASKEAASSSARAFAQELKLSDPAISCASYDSDNDGYVSCAILDHSTNTLINAECAAAMQLQADGCRLVKMPK